jgi:hypothetical protein
MLVQLKVLQLNCRKDGEILTAIMESGLELGTDLVLVQEAPLYQGWRYPGFDYIWVDGGRVMVGIWRDTEWKVRPRPDLQKQAEGDIQVLDVYGQNQWQVRVVNVYDALRRSDRV